jgi:putative membrane protein
MTKETSYNKLITIISILLPLAVAALFGVRIPNVEPLSFLPPIYASVNGLTAILLVLAVVAIKKGNRILHERLMKTSLVFSMLFLVMYIAYHMTSDPTPFGGEGAIKFLYYFILISHIILSIAIIPLVLITYVRTLSNQFDKHKKIAKITFPLWLYVAVSGVVVYLMISPYY